MANVRVSEKNAALLAVELAKLPETAWVTINWACSTYQMSYHTASGLVTTLATSGFLEVQNGWTENEKIRFRLKPSLRNERSSK